MTRVVIPLVEKHGEALRVLSVNVSEPTGHSVYGAAVEAFGIPANRRAVPTLIIGDRVLVGLGEIALESSALVDAGLKAGGLGLPAVPGLTESAGELITASGVGGGAVGGPTVTGEIKPTATAPSVVRISATPRGSRSGAWPLAGLVLSVLSLATLGSVLAWKAYRLYRRR